MTAKPPRSDIPRRGVQGLDVFAIAGNSISGFVHSHKTGLQNCVRQAYTTIPEQYLALYLEYHPHVRSYQRGDASPECAMRYELPTPLGTPFPVPYDWDGEQHTYLPDFVGTLVDGSLFIAEAGRYDRKQRSQELAKADAALRYVHQCGGEFWINTDTFSTDPNHPAMLYQNLIFLHARRAEFAAYPAICKALDRCWPFGRLRTPRDLISELGRQWSESEVEGAVWKRAADAAATGHLLFDLAGHWLSLDVPLALQHPDVDPILLPPLPDHLDVDENDDAMSSNRHDHVAAEEDAERLIDSPLGDGGSGGSIDPAWFESEEERERFERYRNAVYEIVDGKGYRPTASAYELDHKNLRRLVTRWRELGDIALVSHRFHRGTIHLHPSVAACVKTLYQRRQKLTNVQILEHPQIKRTVDQLAAQGVAVRMPSYRQICLIVERLERETNPGGRSPREMREGVKRPARERQSAYSYVLSLRYPAEECQVDEHYLDVRIVTRENEQVTLRVYGAVLVCVKTGAILAFVLSPHALTENDYMRLIKQAIEPKDHLTALYECQHEWQCSAKPMKILYDHGKIFTSKRARAVLVDRLHVLQEEAPAWAPPAKGTVEALFQWVMHEFTHRLPGTTKANPEARGGYDSDAEAIKGGITFDVLEKYFTRAIVDDYMRKFDELRRQPRFRLWNDAVAETGVPRFLGSHDDLKLLLMRAHNAKNRSGSYIVHPIKGVSFLGRWYINPEVVPRLRGDQVTIYYDPRDITIIYLYLKGAYMGPVYCTTLRGRVSIWEAQAMRARDRREAKLASAETADARRDNIAAASAGKAAQKRAARDLEYKRALDDQRRDIHPDDVLALREAMEASLRAQGVTSPLGSHDAPVANADSGAELAESTSNTAPRHSIARITPPMPDDRLAPSQHLASRQRPAPDLRVISPQPPSRWASDKATYESGAAEMESALDPDGTDAPDANDDTPRFDGGKH